MKKKHKNKSLKNKKFIYKKTKNIIKLKQQNSKRIINDTNSLKPQKILIKGIKSLNPITKLILTELFTTVAVCVIMWFVRNLYNQEMSETEMKTYLKNEILNTLNHDVSQVEDININYISKANINIVSDSLPIVVCGTYNTTLDKDDTLCVFIFENDKKNLFHEVVGANPKYRITYYALSESKYLNNTLVFNGYTEQELGVDNNKKICIDYSIHYADRCEKMCLIFDKFDDGWGMAGSEMEDLRNEIILSDSKIKHVSYGNHMFIDSNSNMCNIIATSGNIVTFSNKIYGGLDFAYAIPVVTNERGVANPDKLAVVVMRCYKNHLYYDPNWNWGKYMLIPFENDMSIPLDDYWGFTDESGINYYETDLGPEE